ncbi:MAG: DUF3604 domain-containing protein [Ketobacteraceae bacterium]|nr:DUF3604 domain-containing protein [Ketobacteraceae bacterium]
MSRWSLPFSALPGAILICFFLSGCKESPVPEVPVILKDPVVVDSGQYTDPTGALQEKRLDYSEVREPCALYNPFRNPYVGDLHVHTARSLDANIQNTRTTPAEAYAFARGEPLGIQPFDENNQPLRTVQLQEPLDFAMVSDHAEFFGETRICRNPDFPLAYHSAECESFRADPKKKFVSWNLRYLGGLLQPDGALTRFDYCGEGAADCLAQSQTVWEEMILAAEAAYDKSVDCAFTAFVGYEYTGAPVSFNLHRNVVFRNGDVPLRPLSYMEYPRPENLWKALDETCNDSTNCEALTIPHNSNVSGDMMFRREKLVIGYSDFDADYVTLRNKYEPLIEVFQHKGDSECSRSADELCGFEKFPFNNLISDRYAGFLSGEPTPDSFIRTALKDGLALEEKFGVNPFKYGMVASTDTHLGTPGLTDENNYPGHGGAGADNSAALQQGLTDMVAFGPGGLAVLWAEENSRDYLFDAMQRREAQGTSGPRILMRMYAGWDFKESEICEGFAFDEDAISLRYGSFARLGHAQGVPMGGDLVPGPEAFTAEGQSKSPTFAVGALRDSADSAGGLQTLQIIKGWLDENGKPREAVYNLHTAQRIGIDLNRCQAAYPASDALCKVWRDPDFDPSQKAFYYARVVEQPSCRWSWQQCRALFAENPLEKFKAACEQPSTLPAGYRECCLHTPVADHYPNVLKKQQIGTYPPVIQERAWTSPVWYTP